MHCNSHGIDDEIESIIFIALELLLLSWLDLRLAHGVAFWRLCHSAIEKQAFLCLPDRSAATLVACLDIDVIYLIFDMQFSRCSPDCFTSHPVSGTS